MIMNGKINLKNRLILTLGSFTKLDLLVKIKRQIQRWTLIHSLPNLRCTCKNYMVYGYMRASYVQHKA